MTPERLHAISDDLLFEEGTRRLRGWLDVYGESLTLAELVAERARRRPNSPRAGGTRTRRRVAHGADRGR